jgi:hypothetical protein
MSENYLGNPLLKNTNVRVNYTAEQLQEYVHCAEDPVYFMEKYIKVVNLDHGLVDFKLYPFQRRIVETIHKNRFTICKIPRQSGKSITVTSYLLHYCIFNSNVRVAILANKGTTAKELLDRFKTSYENLPRWLQQGVVEWNKFSVQLENGSKIISAATSSSAVRGGSYNCITGDAVVDIEYQGQHQKIEIGKLQNLINNDMPTHPDSENEIKFEPIANKYYNLYCRIIESAKKRNGTDGYSELHHITPRSLGGSENPENLVYLTAREHYIAHRLLVKCLTGKAKAKMVLAWNLMINGHAKKYYKVSSRQYQLLREQYGEAIRQIRTGARHSQETKQKISNSQKGKTISERTKKIISAKNKGRHVGKKMPKSHGEKISKALLGHKKTKEWVDKINRNPSKIMKTAEKHRGMKRSEESRKRMSDAAKGRVAWNKGKKNPNYNLKWFINKTSGQIIRARPEDAPDGFVMGRK